MHYLLLMAIATFMWAYLLIISGAMVAKIKKITLQKSGIAGQLMKTKVNKAEFSLVFLFS